MTIDPQTVPVRDLVDQYKNSDEEGVTGWGGKLNIRPNYQREYVYKDAKRDAVIKTAVKKHPLSIMYWVKNGENSFEVLDGQQRIISICDYVANKFSVNGRYFENLAADKQEAILDYKLQVYFCEGPESEKLEWFRTINIAGLELNDQELLNAAFAGPWLADAKRHFSKRGCAAYDLAKNYVEGDAERQKYLETALDWISGGGKEKIEKYMAKHQHDENAGELWGYFEDVIRWVKKTFPEWRKVMKGVPWGVLYNKYKGKDLDPAVLEEEVSRLMADDDVTKKSGIYSYILDRDERHLNIRAFTDTMKSVAYEKQERKCLICGEIFDYDAMEGDHITPWRDKGKTIAKNCRMLCKHCNRRKAGK